MQAGLVLRAACLLALSACIATQPGRSSFDVETGQVDCSLAPAIGSTALAIGLGLFGADEFYQANHPDPPPPSDGMIHIDTGISADTHRALGYAALGAAGVAVAVAAIEGTTYGRCRSLERPLQLLLAARDCTTINARLDDIGQTSPAIRRALIDNYVHIATCAQAP